MITDDPSQTAAPTEPAQKPEMTAKAASFQIARAGSDAMQVAHAIGADPDAVDALLDVSGLEIAGVITLKPLTLATVWALEKLHSPYMAENAEGKPIELGIEAIALGALCFSDPRDVVTMIKKKQKEQLEAKAMDLAEKLTVPVLKQINEFINHEMARHAEGEEAPAKKPEVLEPPTTS
jgi:hypothetical protein